MLPEQPTQGEAGALDLLPDATGETTGEAEGPRMRPHKTPSSTSQFDFEAGRSEGLEEGRRAGFDEGKAIGMEEGRTAGRAEASAQLERVIQAFEAATSQLADLTAADSDTVARSTRRSCASPANARQAIAEQPDSSRADRGTTCHDPNGIRAAVDQIILLTWPAYSPLRTPVKSFATAISLPMRR